MDTKQVNGKMTSIVVETRGKIVYCITYDLVVVVVVAAAAAVLVLVVFILYLSIISNLSD